MNSTNVHSPSSPYYLSHAAEETSAPQRTGEKRKRETDSPDPEDLQPETKRRPMQRNHPSAVANQLREAWETSRTLGQQNSEAVSSGSGASIIAAPGAESVSLATGAESPGESDSASGATPSPEAGSPTSASGNTAEVTTSAVVQATSDWRDIDSPPEQYASRSLRKWAEETRQRIMQLPHFSALLERDTDGNLVHEIDLPMAFSNFAYNLYADLETEKNTLTLAEQEQFLHDLEALSDGGQCEVYAQGAGRNDPLRGLSPHAALQANTADAVASNFYVRLRARDGFRSPPAILTNQSSARLTLKLSTSHVIETCHHLVPLLEQFADIITHFKVMAPREQGKRTDNIVVYLNQPDIERTQVLAAQLSAAVATDAWESPVPLGMHPLRPGIAYAELSARVNSTSFGADRAEMLAKALLFSFDNETSLDEELHDILVEQGYSLGNPALIMRT